MAGKRSQSRGKRVSGISEAALKGATGDPTNDPDNAEEMARPAPGLTDPRDGRESNESVESPEPTMRQSPLARDQSPDDDDQEWRRAGGGSPDDEPV